MEYQKKAEATGDWLLINLLIGLQNCLKKSETVTNENDKKRPKERYTSPKEEKKIVDNLK